jgi:hypothetical protein
MMVGYRKIAANAPANMQLTDMPNNDDWTLFVLSAELLVPEAAELAAWVWLMLDVRVVDETEWLAAVPLTAPVTEAVAPEVELAAIESDPTSPAVVEDALMGPPPVLEAVALPLLPAAPSFSAPAVILIGKNVISAGPSVDVVTCDVLYPLRVSLMVQTACVVPARLHAMVSRGTLDERRINCSVEGPSMTVAPPP